MKDERKKFDLYCASFLSPSKWRSWLRHCAISWNAGGSIPDGIIGIFCWLIPSGCTMSLGSTQSLT